jgi:hypothetical protein
MSGLEGYAFQFYPIQEHGIRKRVLDRAMGFLNPGDEARQISKNVVSRSECGNNHVQLFIPGSTIQTVSPWFYSCNEKVMYR